MSLKVTNKRPVINRLVFDYLMNYKLTILIALLMMIISAAATGLHAWLVRPALDEVLIKGNKEMLFLIPFAIIIGSFFMIISYCLMQYQLQNREGLWKGIFTFNFL